VVGFARLAQAPVDQLVKLALRLQHTEGSAAYFEAVGAAMDHNGLPIHTVASHGQTRTAWTAQVCGGFYKQHPWPAAAGARETVHHSKTATASQKLPLAPFTVFVVTYWCFEYLPRVCCPFRLAAVVPDLPLLSCFALLLC
jgi:hypothetical protein